MNKDKFEEVSGLLIRAIMGEDDADISEIVKEENIPYILTLSVGCVSGAQGVREGILNNWDDPEVQEFIQQVEKLSEDKDKVSVFSDFMKTVVSMEE